MNISEKIKNVYKSKGYTLEDLSEKIGVKYQSLSRMLKLGDFKISTLNKIAVALEVPITYLFEDEGNNLIIASYKEAIEFLSAYTEPEKRDIILSMVRDIPRGKKTEWEKNAKERLSWMLETNYVSEIALNKYLDGIYNFLQMK